MKFVLPGALYQDLNVYLPCKHPHPSYFLSIELFFAHRFQNVGRLSQDKQLAGSLKTIWMCSLIFLGKGAFSFKKNTKNLLQ